ncbi:MAG TPA: hypothetical protein VFC92_13920 [Bacteroidales bacterium]|nr:hypothetical protein [Bacteroidales bacterium]
MEQRIATIISRAFHPLIITSYFLIITLNLQFHFATALPEKARWMILGLAVITTFVVPVLLIHIGKILLRQLAPLHPRLADVPALIATIAMYYFAYRLFDQIQLSPIFNLFVLGMASLSVLLLILLMLSNVSVYATGAGALTGAFIGLQIGLGINLLFFIFLSLIIGGLVGFSRLKLETHRPAEIYIGYLLGLGVMLAHYLFL